MEKETRMKREKKSSRGRLKRLSHDIIVHQVVVLGDNVTHFHLNISSTLIAATILSNECNQV